MQVRKQANHSILALKPSAEISTRRIRMCVLNYFNKKNRKLKHITLQYNVGYIGYPGRH